MVVSTPADGSAKIDNELDFRLSLLLKFSWVFGVPVVGSGFGTPGEDGQVQLGNGVHVSADVWAALVMQTTDAAFCERLAVALWGVEVLAKRSVFGKQSNKDIAKGKTMVHRPLSPMKLVGMSSAFAHFLKEKGCPEEELGKRHKQLVRYLAQKCADLRR
ncbi:BEN domain-containing protein 5-like [Amblyomma americanum]